MLSPAPTRVEVHLRFMKAVGPCKAIKAAVDDQSCRRSVYSLVAYDTLLCVCRNLYEMIALTLAIFHKRSPIARHSIMLLCSRAIALATLMAMQYGCHKSCQAVNCHLYGVFTAH